MLLRKISSFTASPHAAKLARNAKHSAEAIAQRVTCISSAKAITIRCPYGGDSVSVPIQMDCISRCLVSLMKIEPMISVIAATITGYQRPA